MLAQQGAKDGQWRAYAAETGSTGYSPLDLINRDNVKNLQVAWSWKFDNFGNTGSETTPIMVERRHLLPAESKAHHRCGRCRHRPDAVDLAPAGDDREDRAARTYARGVAYWSNGTDERIVTITPGFRLVALNAKTGLPIPGFGIMAPSIFSSKSINDYKGDLVGRIGNSSPPVVSNDVIIVGPALTPNAPSYHNVKGDVTAFDVRTGKKTVDLPHHSRAKANPAMRRG